MTLRFLTSLLFVLFTAATALAQSGPPPGLPPQPKVRPAGIPAGAVLLSPCVQGMGDHWAALKDMPLGPIYGTYKGKVIFSEIMIDQKAFAAGKSYRDMIKPLPGYKIDHVDIEYETHGHPGYPLPHYDIHAYYVAHAVHTAYCPQGMPNGTGE